MCVQLFGSYFDVFCILSSAVYMPHEQKQKQAYEVVFQTEIFAVDSSVFTLGHVPFNKTLSLPHYFCSVFVPGG